MMAEKKQPIIAEDELWQALEDAAKPIDFDVLIAEGIIEKEGAWYKVPDMKALPQHASRKIPLFKSTKLIQPVNRGYPLEPKWIRQK